MKKISAYPLLAAACAAAVFLAACSSPQRTAPISDRSSITSSSSAEAPIGKDTIRYTVKSGDTLYQISRRSGHSVADLTAWNNLENANDLKVGQVLRVQPPDGTSSGTAAQTSAVAAGQTESRSIDSAKQQEQAKTASSGSSSSAAAAAASAGVSEVKNLTWAWPADGSVVAGFSSGKNRGIDIAGTKGQDVKAAADGTVLHKGSMNGYGNLVIIKHSSNVLSAYAHNDKILVKEKQQVKRGDKIAEMGSTDADRVKLHFEIRYQGKPVDPAKYLPAK